jgi:hypothetical protein
MSFSSTLSKPMAGESVDARLMGGHVFVNQDDHRTNVVRRREGGYARLNPRSAEADHYLPDAAEQALE